MYSSTHFNLCLHLVQTGIQLSPKGADIDQYFPYLRPNSAIPKDQLLMLKERLYEETDKLKFNFASLMLELKRDLERKRDLDRRLSVEEVVDILVFYDKKFAGVFAECTSFSDVFHKVRDFVSFFDYDLLEHLIDRYGSDAIKKELDKYKDYFLEFSKRRIIECPSNAFSDHNSGSSENVLVLFADKIIENLTLDELKNFNRRVNKILGNKLVKLVRVIRGSICLTFQIFEDSNFVITEEQRQALQKEGVTSITCTYGGRFFMKIATPVAGTYTKYLGSGLLKLLHLH